MEWKVLLILVEILSPTNSYSDRNQKKTKYLKHGVSEFWIVDPGNKTIEIYTPQSGLELPVVYITGSGLVQSVHIPALRFELGELF